MVRVLHQEMAAERIRQLHEEAEGFRRVRGVLSVRRAERRVRRARSRLAIARLRLAKVV